MKKKKTTPFKRPKPLNPENLKAIGPNPFASAPWRFPVISSNDVYTLTENLENDDTSNDVSNNTRNLHKWGPYLRHLLYFYLTR